MILRPPRKEFFTKWPPALRPKVIIKYADKVVRGNYAFIMV